ncbi:MAG: NAD-dependent epimerase/dehydratase family protein [Terracidiphilus sp.]
MPTACVTGAAGFIGFHLCRRLLENGWAVVGIDCLNDYYDVTLKRDRLKLLTSHEQFEFYHLNICHEEELCDVYARQRLDYTVHLAAQVGVRYSLENPRAYTQNNVAGFLNILECCRSNSTKHLVYASSSSVYGLNAKVPFSVRDGVDHPVSIYAATKRTNELMAHVYSHLYSLPTTGLRFFTVYGPWGRPDMAPFIFTKAILEGTPIKLFTDGRVKRDFTFIDDVIDGIMSIIERIPRSGKSHAMTGPNRSWAPYRIYNIGNRQAVDLEHVLHLIESYTNRKADYVRLPMQPGDVPFTCADVSELTEATGFSPRTSIEEGLHAFVTWYREYYSQQMVRE